MPVGYLPEHTAGRIVAIQEQLNSLAYQIDAAERIRLAGEQRRLWDEAFPGLAYEEIAKQAGPFLLAA